MSAIIDIIRDNPDAVVTGVTTLLGWLGIDRWRKGRRAATTAEVDRWAATAVGVITVAIKHGVFKDDEAAVTAFLARFKKLAAAAGVDIKPEHEARALLIAQEKIAQAIGVVAEIEAGRLGAAAEALLANLERLSALSRAGAKPPKS